MAILLNLVKSTLFVNCRHIMISVRSADFNFDFRGLALSEKTSQSELKMFLDGRFKLNEEWEEEASFFDS